VPRVSTQPAGQNDETGVIERGDRHEPAVPDRLTDSEPEREEAGDEGEGQGRGDRERRDDHRADESPHLPERFGLRLHLGKEALGEADVPGDREGEDGGEGQDRKSTRLNSSHVSIAYAVV